MAQKPDDVVRVENELVDLASAKKAAVDEVAAGERAGAKAMRKCESRRPGWERIGAVRVPAQRSLYRRGARILWRELSEVAGERAAVHVYRKRIAYYEAATGFGTCATFERLLRPVRQFPENVRADYLAGDIYNKMVRFVSDSRRKAAARHWGSRQDGALRAARTQLVALGGDAGYATFLAFGHSLRG